MLTSTPRKSSYSHDSNCVEGWTESSYSAGADTCVEQGTDSDQPKIILIRDSKDPDGLHLTFSTNAWRDFITGIKSGEIG